MPFLTYLEVKPESRNTWRLLRPLDYGTRDGVLIRVPAGFVNDLASIPAVFRVVLPVNDLHREAAVLHDYLYYRQGSIWDNRTKNSIYLTRAECDALFYDAMIERGTPRWKARAMFGAVRAFGWWAWTRD